MFRHRHTPYILARAARTTDRALGFVEGAALVGARDARVRESARGSSLEAPRLAQGAEHPRELPVREAVLHVPAVAARRHALSVRRCAAVLPRSSSSTTTIS